MYNYLSSYFVDLTSNWFNGIYFKRFLKLDACKQKSGSGTSKEYKSLFNVLMRRIQQLLSVSKEPVFKNN